MISPRQLSTLGFAALMLIFAGCDSSKPSVKVSGKVMKNGQPMIVGEDTYVTISFVLETSGANPNDAKSFSAKFDQKTGTYSVEVAPGNYRTTVVIAKPGSKDGKLSKPMGPYKSDKVYELTKGQDLDIEVPNQ
ncbi:MAG TPA: hypothetical protein VHR66_17530 [Gemmataceae bacterium]|nr:hypothetical protein [Gemmataceae bacterium]